MKKLLILTVLFIFISCTTTNKKQKDFSIQGTIWSQKDTIAGHTLRTSVIFYDDKDADIIFSGGNMPVVVYNLRYEMEDDKLYLYNDSDKTVFGNSYTAEVFVTSDSISLVYNMNDGMKPNVYKRVK